jgi:hypothetical protein
VLSAHGPPISQFCPNQNLDVGEQQAGLIEVEAAVRSSQRDFFQQPQICYKLLHSPDIS